MLRTNLKKSCIQILIIFTILFLSNSCLAAMSVQEIINNMQKAYEKQMEQVSDYTIIQKPVGGIASFAGEIKTFYKKVKVDGTDIYKSRTETEVMGMDYVSIYDGKYNWSVNPITNEVEKESIKGNPNEFWKNINPSNSRYLGEETIENELAYLLEIDNIIQILGNQMNAVATMQQNEVGEMAGKLWVNSKTWMPLRMQMIINAESCDDDISINTVITTDFKDYRQIGTIMHPHKMTINTSTKIDTSNMSDEEKEEQEEIMKMMQSMMAGMGSFSIDTMDVLVNTGLADDIFDASILK